MVPLEKHWIGQCSLAAVRRLENVKLMAESGCKALFIGFESISDATLRGTGKRQNRPSEFGIRMQLSMALFAMLTPYPGTRLYTRLKAEGRLTHERWWLGQDHDQGSPYFVPKRMSREALREGWQRAWQQFYSPSAMWSRWTVHPRSSWIQTLGYLPLNVMQNRLVKHKIVGRQPRFRSGRRCDPMLSALDALVRAVEPELSLSASGKRRLPVRVE